MGMVSSLCQTKVCGWLGQASICSTNTILLFLCLIVNLYNFINKFGHEFYICLSFVTFPPSFGRPEVDQHDQSKQPSRSCKNHSNNCYYRLDIECIRLNCNDINVGDYQKQIDDQKTKQFQIFFAFVSTFPQLDPKSVQNEQQAEQYQFYGDGAGVIVEYVVFIYELEILKNECEVGDDFVIVEHNLEVD